MSLDITALQLLKTRERYERLAGHVPRSALATQTAILLDDMGAFFKEFPDVKSIKSGVFFLWFKGFRHPTLNAEASTVYEQLLRQMDHDVDPAIEAGLLERLVAAGAAYDTAQLVARFQAGEEIDLRHGLERINEAYDQALSRKVKNPQVLTPIEELLAREADDVGLHFRIPTLNQYLKPVRSGDFYIIAGRPDQGKTSFISSEVTFMAPQVDQLYPGEERSILWLNNEGPGSQIVTRTFQSSIGENGSTIEDLVALNVPSGTHNKTKIRDEYQKAMGGRMGVLRIFDIHGYDTLEVENLIRKYRPALVVFDMIDNVRFAGEANNNGQRTDQLLEAQYQWARYMGVKHDTAIWATSQISVDGDQQHWPAMHMLKDSKTGKQGAADVIMMVASVEGTANSRWISTPKSKRTRTRMPSMRIEVLFDKDRARYNEAPK